MAVRKLVLASRLHAALRAFGVLDAPSRTGGLCLAYIPTADHGGWLHLKVWRPMAVRRLERAGFRVRILDVARASAGETRAIIHAADVVCVSGGNTFYLLRELRHSGAADIIADEVAQGKPYIGISAGAVVAGPDIGHIRLMDDSAEGSGLSDTKGLGFVGFRVVPHLGTLVSGRVAKEILRRLGGKVRSVAVTDRQAIIVKGDGISVLTV